MSRKVLMPREPEDAGLFSLAAFQALRLEALDLFDRCLAERKPEYLEHFLERQIAQEVPPLELLSQIAEDVHQRLQTLRQRHFELGDQVRWKLEQQFGIDSALFIPADLLDYSPDKLDVFLHGVGCDGVQPGDSNCHALLLALQEARETSARLRADLNMADYLYQYLMDWLLALHVVTARGAWTDLEVDENGLIH